MPQDKATEVKRQTCRRFSTDDWQERATHASTNAMDVRGEISPTGVPVDVDRSPTIQCSKKALPVMLRAPSSKLRKATIDRQPVLKRRATGTNGQQPRRTATYQARQTTMPWKAPSARCLHPNAEACQLSNHHHAPTTRAKLTVRRASSCCDLKVYSLFLRLGFVVPGFVTFGFVTLGLSYGLPKSGVVVRSLCLLP